MKAHLATTEKPIEHVEDDGSKKWLSFNEIVDTIGRDKIKIMK